MSKFSYLLLFLFFLGQIFANTEINFSEPLYKDLDHNSVMYKAGQAVVALEFNTKHGNRVSTAKCSGILINESDILTARHCIADNRDAEIVAHFRQGEDFVRSTVQCDNATIAEGNTNLDYAILHCQSRLGKLAHVTRAEASVDSLQPQEELFVVHHQCGGNFTKSGMFDGYSCRYSKRANKGKVLSFIDRDSVDTTIPGGPGSSGSPVFNKQGKLVGVLKSASYHDRQDQIAFVPLSEIYQDLKEKDVAYELNFTPSPEPPKQDLIAVKSDIKYFEPKGTLYKDLPPNSLAKQVGEAAVKLQFRTRIGYTEETVGCGGTLINKTDVITAYHCYEGSEAADLYTVFNFGEEKHPREVKCDNPIFIDPVLDYIIFRCPSLPQKIKDVQPVVVSSKKNNVGDKDLFTVQHQCGGEWEGPYYSSYNCKFSKRVTSGDITGEFADRMDTLINGGRGTSGSSVFNSEGQLVGIVTNGSFQNGQENISFVSMELVLNSIAKQNGGAQYIKSLNLNGKVEHSRTTPVVVDSTPATDDTIICNDCGQNDVSAVEDLVEQVENIITPKPSTSDLISKEEYRIEIHDGVKYRISKHCKFDYSPNGDAVCMVQDDYYLTAPDDFIGVEKIGIVDSYQDEVWIDNFGDGYECPDGSHLDTYLGQIICLEED